jgi:hypothetical protein
MCNKLGKLALEIPIVKVCYGMAHMTKIKETKEYKRYESLEVVEFLEFIGRCAAARFPSDTATMEFKIQQLLTPLFKNIGKHFIKHVIVDEEDTCSDEDY